MITQLTFSFTTTPFLVLSFSDSVRVWSRVYFYGAVWTLVCLVFFASGAKGALKARLDKRQGRANAKMVRSMSTDSLTGKEPILGISKDLESDMTQAMEEIKAEIDLRQRKSS